GLGTGFVVDEQGLIATNLHVLSEGRPIDVELWPDKKLEVLAIEATSRGDDLALIRVAPGEHTLQPLPLGDAEIIAQGAEVLAFGNPLGLQHSVTQGVVSAVREIDSHEMIQVAMPIEPGNSGGPLVDRQGTVRGLINMKSLQADNVGFAVPVERLNELLAATNPVNIDRWVRLAGVDPLRWEPRFGAQWRERSGIIDVTGTGSGFGGRALCLYQPAVPAESFEVAVQVKLDNVSGAAGLVFHADGQDKHYGFYPSNGQLRLTCFRGPSVYSWEVLQEVASPHYVPGQWNYLKVRVQPARIECFVNGQLVIDAAHDGLSEGRVGLAKFRDTQAEFRQFQLAEKIEDDRLDEASRKWFEQMLELRVFEDSNDLESIDTLATSSVASARELSRQAQRLRRQAERLQRLAEDVRLAPLLQQLGSCFSSEEASELLRGTLLIAALDHPDMDIASYLRRVEAMADEIRASLPEQADEAQKLRALERYMFEENGFHGGREEYYHVANNHMDRVIDDREGMPITLAVLYMELGRHLGLDIEGVGLPGHFVVRYRPAVGEPQLIDVFEKARRMSDGEAAQMVLRRFQRLPLEEDLRAQTPLEISVRILHNLVGSAERTGDLEAVRRYAEGLVALQGEQAEFRLMRGVIRYRTDRLHGAAADFQWLLDHPLPGMDSERLQQMRQQIQRQLDNDF
ncbi:MAG: trypsin-like peptidase domain-containing protein, partial [Planctomycetales bacterium]|nr:trypsin-like peptidase domain-containing protein [Planctomycetales bacterium]